MEHAWYCDALAAELGRFADTARGVDPATPVPTCAPWDLGRLLKHVGLIHRWAEQMVREGSDTAVDQRSLDLGLPDDREDYPEWLAAGAKRLVATLRAADPDRPMWAWGPDQHARFWSRRMVHEAVIHHADAQLAVHATPRVDPDLAVDGIDEFLEILPSAVYFAPKVAELRGDGESIHLHCTDAEGEWMITLAPDGFTWDHGHGKGTVAVRGTANDLVLLAYGRADAADETRFTRFGDTALLDRWLAKSAL